jgi:uncharacterized protein (TIGR02145 family)
MVWNTNDEFPMNGDGIYLWDGSKWNYIGGSDGVDTYVPTGDGSMFTGKLCFDIATGNSGINGCSTTDARQKTVFTDRTSQDGVYAAPYSGVQVYTFTPSSAVSNVRFGFTEVVGAGKIVERIVPSTDYSGNGISSACKVTVNYKSSLQNDLSGLTRDIGLKLKLYVIYNDGDADRVIELNTFLQDCACCDAKVSTTKWLNFMCHNLGADMSSNPFTPLAANHGAKYQFGVKDAVLSQATDQANTGAVAGWNGSVTGSSTGWLVENNPCPPGWRLPTKEEWAGVLANNTITRTNNGGSSWASSYGSWSTNTFGNAIKFGVALVLPTVDYRLYNNGDLNNRSNYGYYWSSTAEDTVSGYDMYFTWNGTTTANQNRSYGMAVRCVAE